MAPIASYKLKVAQFEKGDLSVTFNSGEAIDFLLHRQDLTRSDFARKAGRSYSNLSHDIFRPRNSHLSTSMQHLMAELTETRPNFWRQGSLLVSAINKLTINLNKFPEHKDIRHERPAAFDPRRKRREFDEKRTTIAKQGCATMSGGEFLMHCLLEIGISSEDFTAIIKANAVYLDKLFHCNEPLPDTIASIMAAFSGEPKEFWQKASYMLPSEIVPTIDVTKPFPPLKITAAHDEHKEHVFIVGAKGADETKIGR